MSRGGSARVLWGFMDGSIAVILANKEHQGSVSDSVWNVDGMTALTGGFDGQVKLWLADPLECIWTSEVRLERALPDACLRVALTMSSQRGHIVAAFKSGQISFWTGFETERASSISSAQVSQIRIPCPIQEFKSDVSPGNLPTVACLHIDTSAEEATTILIAYKDHPYLYRIRIGNENDSAETTAFGDPSFGPVSTLSPYFATASGEGSFVIAGDGLGYVSIYDWRSIRVSQGSVRPIWRFEAHEDGGAVTSIAWNGAILMTGSSRGTMFAWDGSTFEQLRSFVYQPSRRARHHQPQEAEASDDSIKQIILDPSKDMFIAYARDTVLAWKADPVVTRVLRNSPSRSAKKNKNGYAKHIERLEMKEAIQESRRMVEQESEFHKRAFNREKEHRAQLEKLGLTEAESVEYVLMLSREEALGRGQTSQGHQAIEREEEEGVFDIDESFELGGQPNERKATSHRSSSPSTGSDQSIQLTPALSENQFPPIAVSPTPSSASETRSPSSGKSWSSVASASASGPASISSSFRPVGAGRHGVGHATSSMDDELRYALELSLAEAQSRGQCL
ncbi:hypothetical protein APHAL10511_003861 [Amanita phalloides]|nr:hypothetical protein APHAL10511_003858 [Amanita phalloides]KAK2464113.1 hypothetical protein APHAL10511_003861 [Amanita phalloides]